MVLTVTDRMNIWMVSFAIHQMKRVRDQACGIHYFASNPRSLMVIPNVFMERRNEMMRQNETFLRLQVCVICRYNRHALLIARIDEQTSMVLCCMYISAKYRVYRARRNLRHLQFTRRRLIRASHPFYLTIKINIDAPQGTGQHDPLRSDTYHLQPSPLNAIVLDIDNVNHQFGKPAACLPKA